MLKNMQEVLEYCFEVLNEVYFDTTSRFRKNYIRMGNTEVEETDQDILSTLHYFK